MYILVTYDVNTSEEGGTKRLRQVAKCCKNHGQRVQNSVFECNLPESDFVRFKAALNELIDSDNDSIRIYRMGNNYKNKIEYLGQKTSFDMDGELIV